MPTDTRNQQLIGHQLITKKRLYSPYTYSRYQEGDLAFGISYDSRTYVQARKRPTGFVNPKPYMRVIQQGNSLYLYHDHYAKMWDGAGWTDSRVIGYASGTNNGSFGVPSFDGGLSNKALIGARLQLKDQDVNYSVAFAETSKTASLVYHTATRVAKSIFALKKGNIRAAARHLGVRTNKSNLKFSPSRKRVEREYLALQYGWGPLYNDVYGAVKDMAERDSDSSREGYTCTVKKRCQAKGHNFQTRSNFVADGAGVYFKEYYDDHQSAFVRLDCRLRTPWLAAAASGGFTNPASVAWELVPFSFVADWFLPIGDYLSNLDASLGWDFLAGSLTTRQRFNRISWATPRTLNSNIKNQSTYAYGKYLYFKVNRTVYSTWPLPGLPSFKSPFSSSHVVSSIALLTSATR